MLHIGQTLMNHVLLLYASNEGHTGRIARYVAAGISSCGEDGAFSADVLKASELPPGFSISHYDGVILAGSVRRQKHSPEILGFARTHLRDLDAVPSAFLSVSLSQAGAENPQASPEKRSAAAEDAWRMIQAFLHEAGWHPSIAKPVAGALRYTRYNWFLKFVMKQLARKAGAATDTSQDWIYTDWAGLDRFAEEFTGLIINAKKNAADSQPASSVSVLP
jgi:menaquinone-dependent protoporphyrinogen oxidase